MRGETVIAAGNGSWVAALAGAQSNANPLRRVGHILLDDKADAGDAKEGKKRS
jgi:hypothetical protein